MLVVVPNCTTTGMLLHLTSLLSDQHNKKFSLHLSSRKDRVASAPSSAPPIKVEGGVAPLRAGQGHSFLLRRLPLLSREEPIGLFFFVHFVSKAFCTQGP